MKTSFTKKQIRIMIAILVLGYFYMFFTVILKQNLPQINEWNEKIVDAENRLQVLEEQLVQLPETKRELATMNAADKRYDDFINETLDAVKAIDYMSKLEKLLGKNLSGVGFSSPVENDKGEASYYSLGINFQTSMTYAEIENFISFVDGGTRQVKITNMRISPQADTVDPQNTQDLNEVSLYEPGRVLQTSIGLTLYALDKKSADEIFEVSTNKFEKFGYFDGISFTQGTELSNLTSFEWGGGANAPRSIRGKEIDIDLYSFLAPRDNFVVRGMDRNNELEYMTFKTNAKNRVTINLQNNYYQIEAKYNEGSSVKSFGGTLPNEDVIVRINEEGVPFGIPENENLSIDVFINNNSNKGVGINLNVTDRSRIKVFDRNGNELFRSNELEKMSYV